MGFCKKLFRLGFFFFHLQVLLISWPLYSVSADESSSTSWEISADRITHQKDPENLVAKGDVIIKQQGPNATEKLVIQADRVDYNIERDTINASGNLNVTAGDNKITAESATLDLESKTGAFHKATMFRTENNLHLTGQLIEKTGEMTYHLQDGWITTCPVSGKDAPPWSIRSADTRITRGGYARLIHASFKIKNTPVFYLPYLLLPVNESRETGLLFPEFSQSERDGTGLLAPFFINLSPSSDITLYPGYLSKRGLVAGMEFRYVADYRSKGTFVFSYLDDRTNDSPGNDYKSDGFFRTNNNRYWIYGKADHDFKDGLVGRLDLDFVSDRDYLQEFQGGLIGFNKADDIFQATFQRGFQAETINLRDNTLQLSKIWTAMDLNGALLIVDDIRDESITPTPLWALPRITFNGETPMQHTSLDLAWESEYIYYWREKGLGAHRLDLHPRLVSPLPLGPYFEAAMSAGLRETLYLVEVHGNSSPDDWPGDHNVYRTLYDIDADINTTLIRDFEIDLDSRKHSSDKPALLRHTIRPEVGYQYIPSIGQSHLPQLDSTDRILPKDWISYGINNYFMLTSFKGNKTHRHDFGYFKVSQIYDRREEKHPFSDIFFELNFFPFKGLNIQYDTSVSIYGQDVTHYNLKTNYADNHGNRLTLDYRYKKHQDIIKPYFFTDSSRESVHELNADMSAVLTDMLSAKFDINHSFSTGRIVSSSLHLIYHPVCWSLEMIATKTPEDFGVMLIFSLPGIGKMPGLRVPGL